VPRVIPISDDANGKPAGAPMDSGDRNDPNFQNGDVGGADHLGHGLGLDPTNSDPAEEKGDVHSGLGVTVSNLVRPGMDGSSHDGLWGNPEDPRNYLGDDQWNPPDPSTYGNGDSAMSQAQGQSQLQSSPSMVSPTSSGEGTGAGPSGAFWEQAEGASGSGPSGTGPGMEFGTTSEHGPDSGGQGAGQFSPSGNHSESDQSNSGAQFDVVELAHHANASVPSHIDNTSSGGPDHILPQQGQHNPDMMPDPGGGTPSAHHADASVVHLDISPLPNFDVHMHI
jgi:hypothetical protein